jgi:AraC-like DNA-binding protein
MAMGAGFDYFLDIIPPDMYAGTKAAICRHIAIFEPEEYALGQTLRVDDYHFVLFLGNAPVTSVNHVEYRAKKGDMLVIQPGDICDLLYLSPHHFKRIFKEHTGCTPHRYLLDIRLEKAKELLVRDGSPIEAVARQCGFVNAGHFAVAFKRATKLPPSEYRRIYAQR